MSAIRAQKLLRSRLLVQPLERRTVPTTFTVTNTLDGALPLPGSLRQAIFDANNDVNPDADTINITANGTVTLTQGQIDISAKNLTVNGPGSSKFSVSGNNASRVFRISNTILGNQITVAMNGLTVTKGAVSGGLEGGGIFIDDEIVSLTDVAITDNTSDAGGAGIKVFASTTAATKLTLTNCKVTGNVATDPSLTQYLYGGGISFTGNFLTITNSEISGNTVSMGKVEYANGGGGVYFGGVNSSALLTITGSTLNNNVAGRGGAVMTLNPLAKASTANISNSTISGNNAGIITQAAINGGGGGLYLGGFGKVTVSKCIMTNNKVTALPGDENASGAAANIVYDTNGDTTTTGKFGIDVLDCTISDNFSSGRGGGLGLFAAVPSPTAIITVRNCVIDNNRADAGLGGGLDFGVPGTVEFVESCQITNNVSFSGGGGIEVQAGNVEPSKLTVRNSTIAYNSTLDPATGRGGGIACFGFGGLDDNLLAIENSTIAFNKSAGTDVSTTAAAGGFYTSPGASAPGPGPTVNIISSIIAGNTSDNGATKLDGNGAQKGINETNSIIGVADNLVFATQVGSFNGTVAMPQDPGIASALDFNGSSFTKTLALLATSKGVDAGLNPNNLPFDQRGTGFLRESPAGKTDMGAFEIQTATPAKFVSLSVNGGAAQRSMVTSAAVTFDSKVSFNPGAFTLVRVSDSATVNLTATPDVSGKIVTLTFNPGPGVDPGTSLADGRFTLTIVAAQFNAPGFDGNGDGMAGDNRVITSTGTSGVFRLFGDADGNATVNTADFGLFRLAFGGSSTIFDYDGLGGVGTIDFGQFRQRFGSSV